MVRFVERQSAQTDQNQHVPILRLVGKKKRQAFTCKNEDSSPYHLAYTEEGYIESTETFFKRGILEICRHCLLATHRAPQRYRGITDSGSGHRV